MRLYLVRHGQAMEGLRGGITRDSERPLTDEGKEEMKVIAKALTKLNLKPDLILSSPLVRARQTAEYIAEAFSLPVKLTDSLAPAVSASQLYKSIAKHTAESGANEVFLVGHEPDMGMLLGTLIWAGPEFQMPFKKAGIARIDVSDMPPSGPGTLKWYVTPKIIHSLFG